MKGAGLLGLAPALTALLLAGPALAGLAGVLLPAFGWAPPLGARAFGFGEFRALFAEPGIFRAAALALGAGLAATLASLLIVALVLAGWEGTRAFRALERALAPLLALPHAAAAFGLAFLIAPSGWIARALSPWATGWERPPDLLIVGDGYGLSLIVGLILKEAPFLFLMALAALPAAAPLRARLLSSTMGHGRVSGFLKAVWPQIYPQLRLPVFAVLAYSVSSVDVALILGPSAPPPLSVLILRWAADPDLALRLRAAAGASLLLALTLGAFLLWRCGEALAARLRDRAVWAGGRGRAEGPLRAFGLSAALLTAGAAAGGIAVLALWSFAGRWTFPGALPEALSLRTWARALPAAAGPAAETAALALAATAIALALVLLCLEAEVRSGRRPRRALILLYLPLLIPPVAFLPGLATLALFAGIGSGSGAALLGHLVFVTPYVFLSLAGPWRAMDPRLAVVAGSLGAGSWRAFLTIRAPMALAPILTAAAVGCAVSVGQYLPTLLLGAGRTPTLTTEAVALAAGGDRRAIAAFALMQTAAAFLPFAVALALPRLAWRNRRGMRA